MNWESEFAGIGITSCRLRCRMGPGLWLPENETTIRGFSDVSLLLIDEAPRVPDEIYRAMRPTLVVHDGGW